MVHTYVLVQLLLLLTHTTVCTWVLVPLAPGPCYYEYYIPGVTCYCCRLYIYTRSGPTSTTIRLIWVVPRAERYLLATRANDGRPHQVQCTEYVHTTMIFANCYCCLCCCCTCRLGMAEVGSSNITNHSPVDKTHIPSCFPETCQRKRSPPKPTSPPRRGEQ